ncbi:MAG: DUF308 domain-containing protein [Syntrophaceae bacterium]|nr:DUF308 domain-containing protein [Syntrophaceae bacterium]
MLPMLLSNEWFYGARGILAIILGLFLSFNTAPSLFILVIACGLFILLASLLSLFMIFRPHADEIVMIAIESGVGTCLGLVIVVVSGAGSLLTPNVTSVTVPMYIGMWAIAAGVFGIIHAVLRRSYLKMKGLWGLIISGVVAILFGVGMILQRESGVLTLRLLIAGFAATYGILQLAAALLSAKINHSDLTGKRVA